MEPLMKTSPTKILIRKAISFTLVFCFAAANLAVTQAFAATKDAASNEAVSTEGLTSDLTQLGRQGRLQENLNLETETLQLVKVLEAKGLRQPMIVDEKGESQDALVEQLAIRIANGSLPHLAGKQIL